MSSFPIKLPIELQLIILELYAHAFPSQDVAVIALVSKYVRAWYVWCASSVSFNLTLPVLNLSYIEELSLKTKPPLLSSYSVH